MLRIGSAVDLGAQCALPEAAPHPRARSALLTSYDKHVVPEERVTDFRTFVSGVRPGDLRSGSSLRSCRDEVAHIISGKILVGHALTNDLKVGTMILVVLIDLVAPLNGSSSTAATQGQPSIVCATESGLIRFGIRWFLVLSS